MSEINITYKGNTIATMDASGQKTLLTEGKYCEDNIGITYARPAVGVTNLVQGTFTTGSTRGVADTITIPYSGSGYPIAIMVYVDGGAYNNTPEGNAEWYNSVNRYDVGLFYMTKARMTTAPPYINGNADSYGCTALVYKNSTTDATSYTRTSSMTVTSYVNATSNASSSSGCIRFKGNGTTLSYYVGNGTSSGIGLAPSTKYAYAIIYSS